MFSRVSPELGERVGSDRLLGALMKAERDNMVTEL